MGGWLGRFESLAGQRDASTGTNGLSLRVALLDPRFRIRWFYRCERSADHVNRRGFSNPMIVDGKQAGPSLELRSRRGGHAGYNIA